MGTKANWEKYYEIYLEEKNLTPEERQTKWSNEKVTYKRELASIKDTNSKEYKEMKAKDKEINKEVNFKEKNFNMIAKNEAKIEKFKQDRDTYQELLDELTASTKANEEALQKRKNLGKEAKRLEDELTELKEMEKHCNIALNNPNATPEQQEHARKVLKENRDKQNENQLKFSENQLALQEEMKNPLKEVPQNDIKEIKEKISKINQICEGLVEGKELNTIISQINQEKKEDKTTQEKTAEPTDKAKATAELTEQVNEKETDKSTSSTVESTNEAKPTAESANLVNEKEPTEIGKTLSVDVDGKTYKFTYENKENGVYSTNTKEFEKLGFFKGLAQKAKLIIHRNEYGIDFASAMRADVNIFGNLNDKDKEKYLNYIASQTASCFDIKYDNPKDRYAKALAKSEEKLALKEAEALEYYGPLTAEYDVDLKQQIDEELIAPEVNSEEHEKTQNKYDKMFGEGFDQHENPPTYNSDKDVGEFAKEVEKNIAQKPDSEIGE